MADKKKREPEKALHTIRRGQIIAEIHKRCSNGGYSYLQFDLRRTFQVKSSRTEKTGTGFFAEQEADICDAVKAACAYMRNGTNGTVESSPAEGEEHAAAKTAGGDARGE